MDRLAGKAKKVGVQADQWPRSTWSDGSAHRPLPDHAVLLITPRAERRASARIPAADNRPRVSAARDPAHSNCFAAVTLDRVFLLSERFKRFMCAFGLDVPQA